MYHIIIFGPPGAGKGTQSAQIQDHYHLYHISTGELLRQEIAQHTPLGVEIQQLMSSGRLVDDATIIEMIGTRLRRLPEGCRGVIFDGFPRTVAQAEALDTYLSHGGSSVDCLIELQVSEDELKERLLNRAKIEGRADDTPEVIQNRIRLYTEETLPIVAHYRAKGVHRAVQGTGPIDQVTRAIIEAIDGALATDTIAK